MGIKKRLRYKNPPLVEALCEFRFRKTSVIPNIVIGRFYEQIEKDFPTIETQKGIGVLADETMTSSAITLVDETMTFPAIIMEERTRFISKDGTKLIQIGPGLLVVNQRKPYKDYLSFRSFVHQVFDIYSKLANPEGLAYVGLRYVNRIDVPSGSNLNEIFKIGFFIPESFDIFPDPFLLRLEFSYCDGRDKLITILASDKSKDGLPKVVRLDFEYSLVKAERIAGHDQELYAWMDSAHDKIEEAFHACLFESVLNSFMPED